MSVTKDAIDYMQKKKCTAYAAAKRFGITPATLYAALKRERCPHCGNWVKPKETVENKRVVKQDRSAIDDLLA